MFSGVTDLTASVVSDNNLIIEAGELKINSATLTNSTLYANGGSISFIDNEYKSYSFGTIISNESFEFSIDTDFESETSDIIYAGSGSYGIITLVELNGFDMETLTEQKTLKILYRETATDEIYLAISQEFIDSNKKEINMEDYYTDGKYVVNDTDFIGSLSIGLNDTLDSLVTIVEQAGSSLAVVNRYEGGTRIFNIISDSYTETSDLGVTGSGSMTLNVNGHIVDMAKY
ncbi:MAG: hypothetical protein LUB59_01180, partial [Candidatus Gastranaerophilales bacterium]|nr:hypothetical protein [Candidatus Gastranaerophilales bacterium]